MCLGERRTTARGDRLLGRTAHVVLSSFRMRLQPNSEARSPERFELLLVSALCPVLAVVLAIHYFVYKNALGEATSFETAMRYPAVELGFWALSAPAIVFAAQRIQLPGRRWKHNASILVSLFVATWGVHAIYRALLHRVVYPPGAFPHVKSHTLLAIIRYYAVANLLLDVWIFASIAGLAYGFSLYRQYRERERLLAEARLEALTAELRPHFLFNTLNSIAALACESPELAEAMIIDLSAMLRAALKNASSPSVSLKNELEVLKPYLRIEMARFDKLKIHMDIAAEAESAFIPTLLLQPLVENAILHGVAVQDTGGTVIIRASRHNGMLEVSVRDNGPGVRGDSSSGGIGLANTRERLRQLYGGRHTFEIANAPEGGVLVRVTIPFTTAYA